MTVKEDILLKIAALVRKHGGELAVPARTLHLPEGLRLEGPVNSEAPRADRSEEHTSELKSLMRISYAVFCLKKKYKTNNTIKDNTYYINLFNNSYHTAHNTHSSC